MTESRFERWSRKKAEARQEAELPVPLTAESEPSVEDQELTINESLPEHELLQKYNLPDPDSIQLGTDITGFMRAEIPEFLRRKALRALWKSNPVLAVLDGLNDYDEDFTSAATATKGVKTLYKVGQGFIDKTKKANSSVGEQQDQPPISAVRKPVETRTTDTPESDQSATESLTLPTHSETVASQDEPEQSSRYRPRMHFD